MAPKRYAAHVAGLDQLDRRRGQLRAISRSVSSSVAGGPRAALPLVHGLHPGNRDLMALGDQIGGQLLRRRHPVGPAVAPGEQVGHGSHGEVGRRHRLQVVPGDRERHGYARTDARTVGADHCRAARSSRVEEHLAVAVLADEGGGGQVRVEPFGPGDDRAGGGGHILHPDLGLEGDEDMQSFGSAGLRRTRQPCVVQYALHEPGRTNSQGEAGGSILGGRRIQVEHQMGLPVPAIPPHQGGVVLDRPLVGEPHQGAPVYPPARTGSPAWRSRPRSRRSAPTQGCTSAGSSA